MRQKYKVGLASITDVLIKQSIQLQVMMKYLQVANKHSEKVFELEKIIDFGVADAQFLTSLYF